VVLQNFERFIAQVPLHNFRTSAPEKVKDLIVISESDTRRYKFYAYSVPLPATDDSIKQWANWLIHRDLRAFTMDGSWKENDLISALAMSKYIQDADHHDALVDAWMSWLQGSNPVGDLDVQRLRRICFSYCTWTDHLIDLKCTLILHHDAGSVTVEGGESLDLLSYSPSICKRVRDLALIYFAESDRKPTDPLQMSDDQFCEAYHSHSQHDQPCYKTKILPEQL